MATNSAIKYIRPGNWVNKLEIDLNGGQDPTTDSPNAEWANLLQGIQTMTPAANATADTQAFWADKGYSETDETGKRATFAITGQRIVNDPAQDYIAARFLAMGDSLRTLVRWTDQGGNRITANCTLTSIVPFGGNANARQTFSTTISLNGIPLYETGQENNDDGDGVNGVISGGQNLGLGDGNGNPNSSSSATPTSSSPTSSAGSSAANGTK